MRFNEIVRLYYNYRRLTDDDIRTRLDRVLLVKRVEVFGTVSYAEMHPEDFKRIYQRPRETSLTFDATRYGEHLHQFHDDLEVFATIPFLVKCNSRFFLKPDIGEIFDQITHELMGANAVHMLHVLKDHAMLPETQGEHFIMQAELLRKKQ